MHGHTFAVVVQPREPAPRILGVVVLLKLGDASLQLRRGDEVNALQMQSGVRLASAILLNKEAPRSLILGPKVRSTRGFLTVPFEGRDSRRLKGNSDENG
jgi:hypothetical protein